MQALLDVILPVFFVLGFGYLAVARGWFSEAGVDGLTRFTQSFAIPCLLFRAVSQMDLGEGFDLAMIASFYLAALICFLTGIFVARVLFKRPGTDAVAIGFSCLFSNSVLLGLPITERAFGAEALLGNYAIVALHAPFCYMVGITAMEIVRAEAGASLQSTTLRVLKAMFRNALIIGISLGVVVNVTGFSLPQVVADGADLMARAALPAALFGLGGVLVRYRPEGDLRLIFVMCAISLILHPLLVWTFGRGTGLDQDAFRSAVLTASMAPGINTYIFANMYGVAKRVSASTVLLGTAFSIVSIWVWLLLIP